MSYFHSACAFCFNTHQPYFHLQVYGDKDADGFYMGELNGMRGFVPYNMIEEVANPDSSSAQPTSSLSPQKRTGEHHGSPDRGNFSSSLNTSTSSPGMYQRMNYVLKTNLMVFLL